ncbi:hypothetical protein MHYP_G00300860 [Metynnis hypsauchen]
MAEMTGCKGILGQRGDAPTSGSILKLGSYPEFELVCRTEISLASRLVTWITRMWSSSYVELVLTLNPNQANSCRQTRLAERPCYKNASVKLHSCSFAPSKT